MEDLADKNILSRGDVTEKDRKILGELFKNARTPFSKIAKAVRLSKEVVNYRVKRLMDLGLLTGFNTVIDVQAMGWQIYFIYIKFRNIDIKTEEEIISSLKEHPNTSWVAKCIGNYDLILKVFVNDCVEMDYIAKEIEHKFKAQFDTYISDVVIKEAPIPFSFLYRTQDRVGQKEGVRIKLDSLDLALLKELAGNARKTVSDISKNLNSSAELIKYRLKKLEKSVILKYRPDVWPKKLGYNWYFLSLKLGKLSKTLQKTLEEFLFEHPNVTYYYKSIGSSDIQIELRIKNRTELNMILMEMRGILKDVLKRHDLLMVLFEHKYTYFPNCLSELKPKNNITQEARIPESVY